MEIVDRVVCINAKNHCNDLGIHSGLKEGREYIIYGKRECGCGVCYDVGIASDPPPGAEADECLDCGWIMPLTPIHYARSSRFRKVESKVEYVKKEVAISIPKFDPILS